MKESVSISTTTMAGRPTRRGAGRFTRGLLLLSTIGSLAALGGCRVEMYDQPKYRPLRANTFFADSQSARPYVKGTVPRGRAFVGVPGYSAEATGGLTNGPMSPTYKEGDTTTEVESAIMGAYDPNGSIPVPVTRQLLLRGKERYNIYCSPCHGYTGDGQGMIVQRGFPMPPTFHQDRLRKVPDGYIVDVITNGFGRMFSYASRVAPEDRWMIAAYIRALQLSQNASLEDVPAQERTKLEGSAK